MAEHRVTKLGLEVGILPLDEGRVTKMGLEVGITTSPSAVLTKMGVEVAYIPYLAPPLLTEQPELFPVPSLLSGLMVGLLTENPPLFPAIVWKYNQTVTPDVFYEWTPLFPLATLHSNVNLQAPLLTEQPAWFPAIRWVTFFVMLATDVLYEGFGSGGPPPVHSDGSSWDSDRVLQPTLQANGGNLRMRRFDTGSTGYSTAEVVVDTGVDSGSCALAYTGDRYVATYSKAGVSYDTSSPDPEHWLATPTPHTNWSTVRGLTHVKGVLFCVTDSGVIISRDHGATWNWTAGPNAETLNRTIIELRDRAVIVQITDTGPKHYVCENGGTTWK